MAPASSSASTPASCSGGGRSEGEAVFSILSGVAALPLAGPAEPAADGGAAARVPASSSSSATPSGAVESRSSVREPRRKRTPRRKVEAALVRVARVSVKLGAAPMALEPCEQGVLLKPARRGARLSVAACARRALACCSGCVA